MSSYVYHVRRRNGLGIGFGPQPTQCHECKAILPAPAAGSITTGYGCGESERITAHPDAPAMKPGQTLERSPAFCYACCARGDTERMLRDGRIALYLCDSQASTGRAWTVQNWPGSLVLPVTGRPRHSRDNRGAQRTDVWFRGPDGAQWHGVNIGDNQVLHCKRLKAR